MHKTFLRVVSLFLSVCLIADPVTASTLAAGPAVQPASRAVSFATQIRLTQEALVNRDVPFTHAKEGLSHGLLSRWLKIGISAGLLTAGTSAVASAAQTAASAGQTVGHAAKALHGVAQTVAPVANKVVIAHGDILSRLSSNMLENHGVTASISVLQKINHILNPDVIFAGKTLEIPALPSRAIEQTFQKLVAPSIPAPIHETLQTVIVNHIQAIPSHTPEMLIVAILGVVVVGLTLSVGVLIARQHKAALTPAKLAAGIRALPARLGGALRAGLSGARWYGRFAQKVFLFLGDWAQRRGTELKDSARAKRTERRSPAEPATATEDTPSQAQPTATSAPSETPVVSPQAETAEPQVAAPRAPRQPKQRRSPYTPVPETDLAGEGIKTIREEWRRARLGFYENTDQADRALQRILHAIRSANPGAQQQRLLREVEAYHVEEADTESGVAPGFILAGPQTRRSRRVKAPDQPPSATPKPELRIIQDDPALDVVPVVTAQQPPSQPSGPPLRLTLGEPPVSRLRYANPETSERHLPGEAFVQRPAASPPARVTAQPQPRIPGSGFATLGDFWTPNGQTNGHVNGHSVNGTHTPQTPTDSVASEVAAADEQLAVTSGASEPTPASEGILAFVPLEAVVTALHANRLNRRIIEAMAAETAAVITGDQPDQPTPAPAEEVELAKPANEPEGFISQIGNQLAIQLDLQAEPTPLPINQPHQQAVAPNPSEDSTDLATKLRTEHQRGDPAVNALMDRIKALQKRAGTEDAAVLIPLVEALLAEVQNLKANAGEESGKFGTAENLLKKIERTLKNTPADPVAPAKTVTAVAPSVQPVAVASSKPSSRGFSLTGALAAIGFVRRDSQADVEPAEPPVTGGLEFDPKTFAGLPSARKLAVMSHQLDQSDIDATALYLWGTEFYGLSQDAALSAKHPTLIAQVRTKLDAALKYPAVQYTPATTKTPVGNLLRTRLAREVPEWRPFIDASEDLHIATLGGSVIGFATRIRGSFFRTRTETRLLPAFEGFAIASHLRSEPWSVARESEKPRALNAESGTEAGQIEILRNTVNGFLLNPQDEGLRQQLNSFFTLDPDGLPERLAEELIIAQQELKTANLLSAVFTTEKKVLPAPPTTPVTAPSPAPAPAAEPAPAEESPGDEGLVLKVTKVQTERNEFETALRGIESALIAFSGRPENNDPAKLAELRDKLTALLSLNYASLINGTDKTRMITLQKRLAVLSEQTHVALIDNLVQTIKTREKPNLAAITQWSDMYGYQGHPGLGDEWARIVGWEAALGLAPSGSIAKRVRDQHHYVFEVFARAPGLKRDIVNGGAIALPKPTATAAPAIAVALPPANDSTPPAGASSRAAQDQLLQQIEKIGGTYLGMSKLSDNDISALRGRFRELLQAHRQKSGISEADITAAGHKMTAVLAALRNKLAGQGDKNKKDGPPPPPPAASAGTSAPGSVNGSASPSAKTPAAASAQQAPTKIDQKAEAAAQRAALQATAEAAKTLLTGLNTDKNYQFESYLAYQRRFESLRDLPGAPSGVMSEIQQAVKDYGANVAADRGILFTKFKSMAAAVRLLQQIRPENYTPENQAAWDSNLNKQIAEAKERKDLDASVTKVQRDVRLALEIVPTLAAMQAEINPKTASVTNIQGWEPTLRKIRSTLGTFDKRWPSAAAQLLAVVTDLEVRIQAAKDDMAPDAPRPAASPVTPPALVPQPVASGGGSASFNGSVLADKVTSIALLAGGAALLYEIFRPAVIIAAPRGAKALGARPVSHINDTVWTSLKAWSALYGWTTLSVVAAIVAMGAIYVIYRMKWAAPESQPLSQKPPTTLQRAVSTLRTTPPVGSVIYKKPESKVAAAATKNALSEEAVEAKQQGVAQTLIPYLDTAAKLSAEVMAAKDKPGSISQTDFDRLARRVNSALRDARGNEGATGIIVAGTFNARLADNGKLKKNDQPHVDNLARLRIARLHRDIHINLIALQGKLSGTNASDTTSQPTGNVQSFPPTQSVTPTAVSAAAMRTATTKVLSIIALVVLTGPLVLAQGLSYVSPGSSQILNMGLIALVLSLIQFSKYLPLIKGLPLNRLSLAAA